MCKENDLNLYVFRHSYEDRSVQKCVKNMEAKAVLGSVLPSLLLAIRDTWQ